MEAALAALDTWGPIGLLIVIGFVWIWRVEKALERHEDRCSERYGLIFSTLRDIQERLARIEERTAK